MHSIFARAVFVVVASIVLVNFAIAQPTRIISASFFDPPFPPYSGPMFSTSIAGVPSSQVTVPAVMRVDHWNNLEGRSDFELDLFDSQGVITSVDALWIASNIASNNYDLAPLNGDSTMMNGHLLSSNVASPGVVTVTVSDLASTFNIAAGYEVFVYADTEGPAAGTIGRSQSLLVDDGTLVMAALTMTDTITDLGGARQFDGAVDYDEGTLDGLGVWARFTGLTGPTFRITAMSLNAGDPAFINGFQIVGTHIIPEPAGIGLGALGLFTLGSISVGRRRRV